MSFVENLDELVKRSTNGLHAAHSTWARVRIGDIADLVNGFAFKSSGFNEIKGIPIVRIRDVTSGRAGTFYADPVTDPKMTYVENGQIAIGMDGDFNCRIWAGGKSLLNQRVCTLQTKEEFYSQKFLALVLPGYLKLINDHTSSVTVKHLSSITVREIPVPLPPVNEQRRIVDKIEILFTHLDKGEEALRVVQRQLARYRQSILRAAVTGRLTVDWRAENADGLERGRAMVANILRVRKEKWEGRGEYREPVPPKTDDLPELPEGWAWASIDELMVHLTSGSRDWKQYYGRGEGVFIMAQNVRPMRFDLSQKFQVDPPLYGSDAIRSEVRRNDILITIVGANTGDLCRFPSDDRRHYVCQSVALLRLAKPEMSPFVEMHLSGKGAGRDQLEGFIYGAGRPHLSFEQLRSVAVPLPTPQEQEEIVARVDEVFDRVKQIEAWCETELARSTSLRQSILKDAFAGRLVPQDPTDEPAADLLARIKAGPTVERARRGRKAFA